VGSSLTTIVILVSVIHVAAFAVMIWIRIQRDEADQAPGKSVNIALCAVCGEPATYRGYDGLDPNERHDPHTGRAWSDDVTHYQPLCAAH